MTGQQTTVNHDKGSPRRRRLLAVALLLLAALVALIAYVAYPTIGTVVLGDPGKETLRVENRTDDTLLVYSKDPDGSEHRLTHTVPAIPPNTSVQTDFPCAATELVARTEDGDFVARRGPFRECNLQVWIIESASG